MKTIIRPLREEEIPAASALVQHVFDLFEAPEYAPQGVEIFHRFTTPEAMTERFRSETMQIWGAYRKKQITGVLAARDTTHISLLFVDPAYHRKGVAKGLVAHFCNYLTESRGETRPVTVNSSPYAVGFYLRLGFRPTDSECTVEGIRFTPMEYNHR